MNSQNYEKYLLAHLQEQWESAISEEAAAREAAVSSSAATLNSAITAEATARAQAVSAEATARQTAVSNEVTARNTAINNAVSKKAEIVTGSYNGNGASNDRVVRQINLGFRPKWVLLAPQAGICDDLSGLFLDGKPFSSSSTPTTNWSAQVVANGFEVRNYSDDPNLTGHVYFYLAAK